MAPSALFTRDPDPGGELLLRRKSDARLNKATLGRVEEGVAPLAGVQTIGRYLSAIWPESHTTVTMVSKRPIWFPAASFTGIVADGDHLMIRSYHEIDNGESFLEIYAETAITKAFLADVSKAAGVQLAGDTPIAAGSLSHPGRPRRRNHL